VCRQLPRIAEPLGKREFKRHLEPFVDPLFSCLTRWGASQSVWLGAARVFLGGFFLFFLVFFVHCVRLVLARVLSDLGGIRASLVDPPVCCSGALGAVRECPGSTLLCLLRKAQGQTMSETNRIHLVLFGMQNRTSRSYLAAIKNPNSIRP
jgi:hypothetical protein